MDEIFGDMARAAWRMQRGFMSSWTWTAQNGKARECHLVSHLFLFNSQARGSVINQCFLFLCQGLLSFLFHEWSASCSCCRIFTIFVYPPSCYFSVIVLESIYSTRLPSARLAQFGERNENIGYNSPSY